MQCSIPEEEYVNFREALKVKNTTRIERKNLIIVLGGDQVAPYLPRPGMI